MKVLLFLTLSCICALTFSDSAMDPTQITLRELVARGDVIELEKFLSQLQNPAAEINTRDSQGKTALFWAPNVATARLLVRYGAYFNDNNFGFGIPRQDPLLVRYPSFATKELYGPRPLANAVQIFSGPSTSERATQFYTPDSYPAGTYVPDNLKEKFYTPTIYRPTQYAPGIYPSNIHLPAQTKQPTIKNLDAAKKESLRADLVRLCIRADAPAVEQFILSLGVDYPEEIINAKDPLGRTAIFFTNNHAVAKILIQYGADLEVIDFEGTKPEVFAGLLKSVYFPTYRQSVAPFTRAMHPEQDDYATFTAKVIAPAVVPGELTNAEKKLRSQEYIATQKNKIQILQDVITNGAAAKDISNGIVNPVINNMLRDQNLDINRTYVVVPNIGKVRPIHLAVMYGNENLIQYMCNRGAHINDVTANGKTALDLISQGLTPQPSHKIMTLRTYLVTLGAGTSAPGLAAAPEAFEWNWLD